MEQFADYLFDDPDQVPKAALTRSLAQGERVVRRGLYDKGKVEVNVAGEWKRGKKGGLQATQATEGRDGGCIRDSLCC